MSDYEGFELLKKVERYEAAVKELQAAHEDVKDVLIEGILFDRWQQLGAQLGFESEPLRKKEDNGDLAQLNQQISAMSDAWTR